MIKPFRALNNDFMNELLNGRLKVVLQFKQKFRRSFMVEIRNNFLDLYFLGHTVEVRQKNGNNYSLIASKEFNPSLSQDELKSIVKPYGPKKWEISFKDIKNYQQFEDIMSAALSRIVLHRKGSISEGVSELNHFMDNRTIGKNGVLVVDRQIVYPGVRESRIDLLGLKRLGNRDKFTFAVIELKNKNNIEISKVFDQTKRYIDVICKEGIYERFKATYEKVLEQKMKLRFLKRIKCEIACRSEITKKDIMGIVVLDNFNIKSDLKGNGLLSRALDDWRKVSNEYNIRLFLKTNVLDDCFFMNFQNAKDLLSRYKQCNS